VAEFAENLLVLLNALPSRRVQLEPQLEALRPLLTEELIAQYPDILERWNVYHLAQQLHEDPATLTDSAVRSLCEMRHTLSQGDAKALQGGFRSGNMLLTRQRIVGLFESYAQSIPMRFSNTTQKLKELAAETLNVEDTALEVAKENDDCPVAKRPKKSTPSAVCPAAEEVPRRSKLVRQCQSTFHERFGGGHSGSTACPYCVVCHMLEGIFHNYRKTCGFRPHAFPPTPAILQRRLAGHPEVAAIALSRLDEIQRGKKLEPIGI